MREQGSENCKTDFVVSGILINIVKINETKSCLLKLIELILCNDSCAMRRSFYATFLIIYIAFRLWFNNTIYSKQCQMIFLGNHRFSASSSSRNHCYWMTECGAFLFTFFLGCLFTFFAFFFLSKCNCNGIFPWKLILPTSF